MEIDEQAMTALATRVFYAHPFDIKLPAPDAIGLDIQSPYILFEWDDWMGTGKPSRITVKTNKGAVVRLNAALSLLQSDNFTIGIHSQRRELIVHLIWHCRERPVQAEQFGEVLDEGPYSCLTMVFRMRKLKEGEKTP